MSSEVLLEHATSGHVSDSDVAIRVDSLGKCYRIYDKPEHRLWQGLFRGRKQFFREFWALRDVSFEVRRGETVGIIGRNGSGKSTLLQLICGTLTPTTGNTTVNGRVSALLELGAGFSPEFTGRENVYMNGTVLGLSHREIDERFGAIAAFADIGDFISQPVKTYSSGMYVRLAFAIAVAVDPDILIIDEALSVGDLAFQNKCMARIREMSARGATILFVSHDLSTSQVICHHAIWLDGGRVVRAGDPVQVCRDYYVASLGESARSLPAREVIPQQETGMARFTEARILDWSNDHSARFRVGDRLTVRFALHAIEALEPCVFALSIYRADGDWLIGQSSREAHIFWPACGQGEVLKGEAVFEGLSLAPGEYRIALAAFSQDLAICYGMTGILPGFSVVADYPTWGKFIHPVAWRPLPELRR